jgi:hypothetical protein
MSMKYGFLDKSGHISLHSVAFVTGSLFRSSLSSKMSNPEITNENIPHSLF